MKKGTEQAEGQDREKAEGKETTAMKEEAWKNDGSKEVNGKKDGVRFIREGMHKKWRMERGKGTGYIK